MAKKQSAHKRYNTAMKFHRIAVPRGGGKSHSRGSRRALSFMRALFGGWI